MSKGYVRPYEFQNAVFDEPKVSKNKKIINHADQSANLVNQTPIRPAGRSFFDASVGIVQFR